jgi:hypothetical protein
MTNTVLKSVTTVNKVFFFFLNKNKCKHFKNSGTCMRHSLVKLQNMWSPIKKYLDWCCETDTTKLVFFLVGYSPASRFYVLNTVSSTFVGGVSFFLWRCSWQSALKLWHIKFRHQRITQKKEDNLQNMVKVWNQEILKLPWRWTNPLWPLFLLGLDSLIPLALPLPKAHFLLCFVDL